MNSSDSKTDLLSSFAGFLESFPKEDTNSNHEKQLDY